MSDFLFATKIYFFDILTQIFVKHEVFHAVPIIFLIEIPLTLIIIVSVFRTFWRETFSVPMQVPYYPKVSLIITCYSEGEAAINTLKSCVNQLYKGFIEVLVMIDGATGNIETYNLAMNYYKNTKIPSNRQIKVIPKWVRGGLVSSRNLGLKFSKGELVMVLDGDCSCDNDMVANMVHSFYDDNVIASSGALRVRNLNKSLATKFQGIEYLMGIQLGRVGLANLGIVNNISGAFGCFKKETLLKFGGWRTGTAEDLDLTLRMKAYNSRYPNLKIRHEHRAIVHTDVPDTWKVLFIQRLRWDGDLYFIFFRRFWKVIKPQIMTWKVFTGLFWYNILYCVVSPSITFLSFLFFFLFFKNALPHIAAVGLFLYLYYCITALILYTIYLVLVSERKKEDLKLLWLIPLYPFYQYTIRFVTVIAIIIEIFLQTHKNSGMAPWWVLKKGLKEK